MSRPGWRTSEMAFGTLAGTAIVEMAHTPTTSVPDAVVRAAACLALAWIATHYASKRTEAKSYPRVRPPPTTPRPDIVPSGIPRDP